MQTFSNWKTSFQKGAKDTSAASWTDFGINQCNIGLHLVEAALGIVEQERVRQGVTIVGDRTVELPEDLIRLKKIYLTVGGRRITPTPVYDDDIWQDLLQYNATETTDYPVKYFTRDNYIELYGTPVTANPCTFIYQGTCGDLFYEDSEVGTVTFTNGSTTITGSGTAWDASFVGRWIKPTSTNYWYQIASVSTTTSAALRKKYQRATASGSAYKIGEIPYTLPDAAQHIPVSYALWQYYLFIRRDVALAKMHESQYNDQLKTIKGTLVKRNQSVVIPNQNNLRKNSLGLSRSVLANGLTGS